MQRAADESAAANSATRRERTTVPGPRVAAARPAVRTASRPGFRGMRPLFYQLLAFTAAAIPSAAVAVGTLGTLLYYVGTAPSSSLAPLSRRSPPARPRSTRPPRC